LLVAVVVLAVAVAAWRARRRAGSVIATTGSKRLHSTKDGGA
jgi:hypothetical protein